MKSPFPHQSVLLNEILNYFESQRLETFFDGTLGAGGHAEAILNNHPELIRYVGMDQDTQALKISKERLGMWTDKLSMIHGNFVNFDEILKDKKITTKFDGILVDLGVSSMQLDTSERGFSISQNGPLDMRMNTESSLTAEEIINTWSERELGKIFRDFGEEKSWRKAARAIVEARSKTPIQSTGQLVAVLSPFFSWNSKKKIHPLTLIFQGLRIAVNRELERLEAFIPKAIQALTPGGRLAIISFHSLEDRIVKEAFRYAASDKESTSGIAGVFLEKEPVVKSVTKKPITPQQDELIANPRSRSAKLRVVEKI